MSLNNLNNNSVYGFNSPLQPILNVPIIATVAPTANDLAEIGSQWVDTTNGDVYFLTKVEGSAATWTAASGNGAVLTDLTVAPGPVAITGDFTLTGTNVNLTSTADMNLTTSGAGIDLNLATLDGSITAQASEDATNAIYLQADGGINATILIENTLGTGLDAIQISAPAGTLDIDVASIDIASTSSFDITATGDITLQAGSDLFLIGDDTAQITGSGAFANAILLDATDVASGIDVNAGTAGVIVDTTGAISLDSAAASNFTVAGAFDLTLRSTAGSIVITGDQAAADAVQINATSGGGVDINAGILGMTIDSAAAVSIGAGAASDFTVTGAFDLDLASTLGAVNISSGQIAVDAIVINASAGGMEITSDNMVLDATQLNVDVTTSLTLGSDATITTVDMVNISPTVNRTTTINGGAVITANSDTLNLATGGLNTDIGASKIVNVASGDNLLGTTTVNVGTGTALSGTHSVNIGTGIGGGTKRITMGDVDALTIITAYGDVNINTSTSDGDTVIGNKTNGGSVILYSLTSVDIDPVTTLTMAPTSTVTTIDLGNITPTLARTTTVNGGSVGSAIADTLNLGTGVTTFAGATKVVNIATGDNTNGDASVNIATGTTATGSKTVEIGNADALTAINLTGVIALDGGTTGAVSVDNVQVATAAPGPAATASATNHARVGSVTFSGYTQGASATMVLTLTNSFIAANSCILATATNVGANDAQMHVTRILPGAGTADITILNGGAAALNGDMQLNFWVLS